VADSAFLLSTWQRQNVNLIAAMTRSMFTIALAVER